TDFKPIRVGEWWDESSDSQVDLVALASDGRYMVGECKWGEVNARDLATLRMRASNLATLLPQESRGDAAPILALCSARGEADAAVREAVAKGDVEFYTADDMVEGRAWRVER